MLRKQCIDRTVLEPGRLKSVARVLHIVSLVLLIIIGVIRIVSTYTVFSQTNDESAHIATGMEWLDRGSYKLEVAHPPLARVAVAIGPWLQGRRYSGVGNMWEEGNRILYARNQYTRTLSLARLGVLPLFLLGACIVWYWSRTVYGATVALVAVGIFTTLPSVLAHSSLATTDMPLTATLLSALWILSLWIEQPTLTRSVLLGLFGALSILSKFSAVLFLPSCMLALMACRRLIKGDSKETPNASIRLWLRAGGVAVLTALLVIWAGYRFSLEPLTTAATRPHATIDHYVRNAGRLHDLTYFVAENIPVPALELFQGIEFQRQHNSQGHPGYLFGQYSNTGWLYYFPVAFVFKSPLPFLVLVGVGLVILAAQAKRQKNWRILAPAAAAVSILLACLPSHINIGSRYILPIYPLLAIVAASGVVSLWNLRRPRFVGPVLTMGLLAWLCVSSVRIHPDYLAYFNELAGTHPDRILLDSDLDWGQDLLRLSDTLHTLHIETAAVAYFGTADLNQHLLLRIRPLLPNQPTKGWIAISEMYLKGLKSEPPHNQFAWLEAYKPVVLVGRSIKLYYLPEDASH